jgi:hypothetical protein
VDERVPSAGNGGPGRGLIDVVPASRDCVLFTANVQKPPPDREMPLAISEVLQKWMRAEAVAVRATLPVVRDGNTIGLFVWFDPAGP